MLDKFLENKEYLFKEINHLIVERAMQSFRKIIENDEIFY